MQPRPGLDPGPSYLSGDQQSGAPDLVRGGEAESDELVEQVVPIGVGLFDQSYLPVSPPAFDALFVMLGIDDARKKLGPDQSDKAMFGAKL